MTYVRQDYLADVLAAAGLTVIEVTDPIDGLSWTEHAAKQPGERIYDPVGLVNHHTASVGNYPDKPWYPVDKLRLKCNLTIDPAGTVYVISAGYQYDTGYGDRHVLDAIRDGTARPAPTDTYIDGKPGGANPGVLMNPWFIDVEVQHPGDGRPITDAQYDALIRADAAILSHHGWDTTRLVGHLETTRRKIDPYWNHDRHAMDTIRADTATLIRQPEADPMFPIIGDTDNPTRRLFYIEQWQLRLAALEGFPYVAGSTLEPIESAGMIRGVYDEAMQTVVARHVDTDGHGIGPREAAQLTRSVDVNVETVEVVRAVTVS